MINMGKCIYIEGGGLFHFKEESKKSPVMQESVSFALHIGSTSTMCVWYMSVCVLLLPWGNKSTSMSAVTTVVYELTADAGIETE